MSKRQVLILLGIFVMAFLYLGFPSGWDKMLALVAGFVIVAVSYSLKLAKRSAPSGDMPYVEHKSDTPSNSGAA